ncbi:DUF5405 family protein [Hafnia paralvei]|uniref:DUF5405 family protein n=1 Tax=Hafnia paralvei TaxID=546367 RepID=UPI00241C23F0|nr:DUF5405 family protein [Hafnia paralvei]
MAKTFNWVFINNWYAIAKFDDSSFILADIKTDKETKIKHYPARAVYSDKLNLIADITNLCVKRGIYLKTIQTPSELMRESHHFNELSQKALFQLDN